MDPLRIRADALRNQDLKSATEARVEDARATSTRSTAGSVSNSSRTASRNRLRIRLRITAPPTFDETVSPTRATAPGIPCRTGKGSRGLKLAASGPSAKL